MMIAKLSHYSIVNSKEDIPMVLDALKGNDDPIVVDAVFDNYSNFGLLPIVPSVKCLGISNINNGDIVIFITGDDLSDRDIIDGIGEYLSVHPEVGYNTKRVYGWLLWFSSFNYSFPLKLHIIDDVYLLMMLVDNRLSTDLYERASLEFNAILYDIDYSRCTDKDLIEVMLLHLDCIRRLRDYFHSLLDNLNFIGNTDGALKIKEGLLDQYQLELDCIPIYSGLEVYGGVNIDLDYARVNLYRLLHHIDLQYKVLSFYLPGCFYPVNLSSTKQLKEVLFHPDGLDLPIKLEYCKKKYSKSRHPVWLREKLLYTFPEVDIDFLRVSCDSDTVELIISDLEADGDSYQGDILPVLKRILYTKKLESYLTFFRGFQMYEDWMVHYRVTPKQVTGRLSVYGGKPNPNLLKKNPDIEDRLPFPRGLMISRDGYSLVSADFKTMELRVLLMLVYQYNEKRNKTSSCRRIRQVMKEVMGGVCLLSFIINEFYSLGYDKADLGFNGGKNIIKSEFKALRDTWKRIVYALLYGQGKKATIELIKEANRILMDKYNIRDNSVLNLGDKEVYKRFRKVIRSIIPGMFSYLKSSKDFACSNYFITSPDGRLRRFDFPVLMKYKDSDGYKDYHGDLAKISREAKNFPIQAFCSFVFKKLLLRIYNEYPSERNGDTGVRMILPRHDEVILEVRDDVVDEVIEKMKHIVRDLSVVDLGGYGFGDKLILELDYAVCKRWSDK